MYNHQPIEQIHGRQQALLTCLVLNWRQPQSRQRLASLFWPDSADSQALTNLRRELHTLRRAVPNAARFLVMESGTVRWAADATVSCDVAEFEAAIERGDLEGLREAMRLYQGALLPDCYEDWIAPERERLRAMAADGLKRLLTILEQHRVYPEALEYARRLLAMDPLDETAYRSLMRLHALQGERAAALHAYHSCATILERELRVAPEAETRAVYQRLLDAREAQSTPLPVTTPLLVGRDREWAAVLSAWHAAAEGRPQMVLIQGEAGIGKTRLAEELVQWCTKQGIRTAHVRSYPAAVRLTLAPVADLLRSDAVKSALGRLERPWLVELARLLPELTVEYPGSPTPEPLVEGWQRRRFFEALTRAVLSAAQPLLLVLDDLQWCDQETLEWLHHLLGDRRDGRFLLVATLRVEEVQDNPGLSVLLDHLHQVERLAVIDLGPLDETGTGRLAAHVAGRPLNAEAAASLFRQTEGHPLFVVETVRAGGTEHSSLTPKVQAVMAARLNGLSQAARGIVQLAACVGRDFSAEILTQASDLDEKALITALDELWQRRIVREHGAYGYDFSHDRMREVAYLQIPPAARRVLHKRIAQALTLIHAADLDAVSIQLATHYERAGQTGRALQFYRRAAERAAALYANATALEHYSRILELAPPPAERFSALLGRGDVCVLLGQYERARQDFDAARALAHQLEDLPLQAVALDRLGNSYRRQDQVNQALDFLQTALTLSRKARDPSLTGRVLNHIGFVHFGLNEHDEALRCHQEAREIFEQTEDVVGLAESLNGLGENALWLGRFADGLEWCSQSAKIAEQIGNRSLAAENWHTSATSLEAMGDYTAAKAAAERSVTVLTAIGDVWNLSFALLVAARVAATLGDFGKALEYATKGLELSREIAAGRSAMECLLTRGSILREIEDPNGAWEADREADDRARAGGFEPYNAPFRRACLALDALALGRTENAAAYIEEGRRFLAAEHRLESELEVAYAEGRLLLAFGRAAAARDMAGGLAERATATGARHYHVPALLLAADAAIALGHGEAAAQSYSTAAAEAERTARTPALWRALAGLAEAQRILGRERESAASAARAQEIVERLAATVPDEQLRTVFLQSAKVRRVLTLAGG
jgi:predicted ATPase/DNA-binding SARP family transcriptional activator